MTREIRRNELIKEMETTGIMMKDKYLKSEVERGYRAFQKMLVTKIFEENHAENLRMGHVISHLNDLACEAGLENSDEMQIFMNLANEFERLIAVEIAGNKGERLVNRALKMVASKNHMISNIEFGEDEFRTELDKIVITKKGIFLIEVKTAKHNMTITEEGNYVREDGEVYGNIGEKVNEKVFLLSNAVKAWADENSKKINIVKLVVFANNDYKLEDNYKYFQSCYCSGLPHIIDEYEGENLYAKEDMQALEAEIKKASDPKEYKVGLNFDDFRYAFADIVAMIEEEIEIQKRKALEAEQKAEAKRQQRKFYKKIVKALGYSAATCVSVLLATKATKVIK